MGIGSLPRGLLREQPPSPPPYPPARRSLKLLRSPHGPLLEQGVCACQPRFLAGQRGGARHVCPKALFVGRRMGWAIAAIFPLNPPPARSEGGLKRLTHSKSGAKGHSMSGYKAPCMSRKEFAPALSPEPTGRNFQISPVLSETCHRLGKILSETFISKPRRRSLRLAVTHMSHLRQTQLQWGQSHRHYLFCRHGLYFLKRYARRWS